MKKNNLSTLAELARGSLLAAALAVLAPASSHAQITNPGFELGTTGWTETGGSGNFSTPTTYAGAIRQSIPQNQPTSGSSRIAASLQK